MNKSGLYSDFQSHAAWKAGGYADWEFPGRPAAGSAVVAFKSTGWERVMKIRKVLDEDGTWVIQVDLSSWTGAILISVVVLSLMWLGSLVF